MIKLLIVEPYKLIQAGLVVSFNGLEGFEVVGAVESGEEALEEAAKGPDIILMNVDLPEITGIATTRLIKELYPDIRIIALSVTDEEGRIMAVLEAGADAYCLKRNAAEHLKEAIVAVEQGGAWLDPPVARKIVNLLSDGSLVHRSSQSALQLGLLASEEEKSYNLTEREHQILVMIAEGKSNEEIAKALLVSYHTIKSDVTQIFLKLGVNDRVQAAVKAFTEGLAVEKQ